MVFIGRARLVAALAGLALLPVVATGAATARRAPVTPPSTGRTATIEIVEAGGRLLFRGPPTVAVGDELEIVNTTDPARVGPMTFSLVGPGYLPKTRQAQARCFSPGHICWSIAEWQGVHGEGVPTINPAEAGAPGWDTPGTTSSAGDSWFTGVKPGTHFAQEVTARAGSRLWFMDAIHPWLRGTIRVVAPT